MKRCITRSMEQNRAHKKDPQIRTHTYIIKMAGQINSERRIHSEKNKISLQTHIKSRWTINLNTKEVITKFMINIWYINDLRVIKYFLNKTPKVLLKNCYTALKLSFQKIPEKGLKTNHSVWRYLQNIKSINN